MCAWFEIERRAEKSDRGATTTTTGKMRCDKTSHRYTAPERLASRAAARSCKKRREDKDTMMERAGEGNHERAIEPYMHEPPPAAKRYNIQLDSDLTIYVIMARNRNHAPAEPERSVAEHVRERQRRVAEREANRLARPEAVQKATLGKSIRVSRIKLAFQRILFI
jgi:hypothetical protein